MRSGGGVAGGEGGGNVEMMRLRSGPTEGRSPPGTVGHGRTAHSQWSAAAAAAASAGIEGAPVSRFRSAAIYGRCQIVIGRDL